MRLIVWIHVYRAGPGSDSLADERLLVEAEPADLMSLDFGRAAQERISAALAQAETRLLEKPPK